MDNCKFCTVCNKEIKIKNWSRHTKTKKHVKNQLIMPTKKDDKDELIALLKKQLLDKDNEIATLKEQIIQKDEMINKILDTNKTTNNTTNNNITINIQNFGNENLNLDDTFLYKICDNGLSNQQRRLMIQEKLNEDNANKNIICSNIKNNIIQVYKNNKWQTKPARLIAEERARALPNIYLLAAKQKIQQWDEDNETKDTHIKRHKTISKNMREHKYTKQEQEDIRKAITCNAYDNNMTLL